jgi:ABC-2 type transport system permease protein
VAHDDGALDVDPVEHGESVRREVSERVSVRGPSTLAVASRIRRDEPKSAGDRTRKEIPVAAVVADAVKEQGWRPIAGPRPIDELGSSASDPRTCRHLWKYSSTVIADLRALVERRELLADFAWRELRARYKGSALGFAWNFVNPLLQLVVFWILFGVVLRTRPVTASGEQPYAIFLFVGLLPWTFFATSLQSGASAILANAPLVKKVRMPLQLLPAASVLSALANFLLSFVVLLAVLAIFGPRHPEGLIWIALLVVLQIVMNLGFAYLLGAFAVFFRDVQHILGILLLAWYFLTPVLFPVALLETPDRAEQLRLLYINPMTAIIVAYQRALLDGLAPQWDALAYSAAFAVVLFVVGFWYFDRTKDEFESAL